MDSQPRKQRRAYELWLKKNDPAKYREWKAESQARGRQIHAENVEKVRQAESEQYESIQTKMIYDMRNEGFSDSEIDEHVEDWAKTIKVWGSDERPMRRREIKKSKENSIGNTISYNDLDEE
jgi:hypothetical protein